MKASRVFSALLLSIACPHANEQPTSAISETKEDSGPDPAFVRALTKLEAHIGVRFNVSFPKNYDIDTYRKVPLALIELSVKKWLFTRPIVNPFDEPRSIEWMIGPEDPDKFTGNDVDCSITLGQRGEFERVKILSEWAKDHKGSCFLDCGDGESGTVFFERAHLTYQARAKEAKDSVAALKELEAFEKIATRIQELVKKEMSTRS
jgi:hypothetical protein